MIYLYILISFAATVMLTKEEHTAYWVKTANNDWKVVKQLFDCKSYTHALFWAHLVLEKLLKAHWVKDNNENIPPKVHNLLRIAEQTNLEFTDIDKTFLTEMNQFQLEGRYPDYLFDLHKKYKSRLTKIIIDQVDIQRKWLLKKL